MTRLAKYVAYRAHADEDAPAFKDNGRVFARSGGGSAVGFDLPYAGGHIVFLPAIQKPESIRQQVAEAMVECLANWETSAAGERPPEWIRKEAS